MRVPKCSISTRSTCIDCNLCVASRPVEAIYSEHELPERYKDWTRVNAEECEKYPTTSTKKDALPGALTLAQWKEIDAQKFGTKP
jgi:ferredoxin